MQLSQLEIRGIRKQIKIQKANEIVALLLSITLLIGLLGLAQHEMVLTIALVFSVFLCLGLLTSRPSKELKNLLQSIVNSDADNITNSSKS